MRIWTCRAPESSTDSPAEGIRLGRVAGDEEARVVQRFDEAGGELVENLGAFLSPETGAQPPAHPSRPGVLADPRATRPGTEERYEDPAAARLLSKGLREGGQRRVARVIRNRQSVAAQESAVRNRVDDMAGAARGHVRKKSHAGPDRTQQVGLEHPAPVLGGDALQLAL